MSQGYAKAAAEQLKEGSLWAFISLLLAAIGAGIPVVGFLVTGVGAYLFLTRSRGSLEASLRDLRSSGLSQYDGSGWVRYVPYALGAVALGELIMAAAALMALASIPGPGALIAVIVVRELGYAVAALGWVGVLLASIFPGLEVYDVGSRLNDDLLRVAGILIIVPFADVVGWIITFVEADPLAQRLGGGGQQPGPS
ncbi:hypothetical protein ASAC_1496 [Acidilobus saccharovorans 345-15]|uniref:Uncharacterized protein n=1 Tax=Acidilobus saccharovorans (strain DSM 16705 / JCM 18335 / VKM B-2471 / 345-15) TaxID=666510 RepID=D9PZB4_ACIS3|nr:DUF973 family protein [Acidilobus saccharovorans]ADL19901.1 hypothetical protein ASAC_1496 [Acidilobus saccharovorans 345-15]